MSTIDETLQKIVEEAKQAEALCNQEHPERHGYGFVNGEAKEFLQRIEWLERAEEKAQQAKVSRRVGKIGVMSNDKLYSRSPEEVYLAKEHKEELKQKIRNAKRHVPLRGRKILDSYYGENYTQVELADKFNIDQSTVSRIVKEQTPVVREALQRGGTKPSA
jgi:RNA polymerase sigma factor (sigma-70 family)